jgi:acyl-CoA thioester hydrolase
MYGAALTTGSSVHDVAVWPDLIEAVSAEQVRAAAAKWLSKKRAVTGYLLATNALDPLHSPVITLVVETRCSYFESTSFPDIIEVGIAIQKLGTSSMTYQIGIFKQGQDVAIAQGYLIHVAVDRTSQTPTPIPEHMRAVLEAIQI